MSIASAGTSLQGTITTTLRELSDVFGEPTFYYPGEKVTVEWEHTFKDGTVVTIYDWKRYDAGAPDTDEFYEYHIGGFNKDAVDRVKMAVLLGTNKI
jgi:hypothetical protein